MKDLRKCCKHKDIRKQQKEIKKRCLKLKNDYYQDLADNINTAAAAREVEKEFALSKKYTAFKTQQTLPISLKA